MRDIVDELRDVAASFGVDSRVAAIVAAADEIDRLRGLVRMVAFDHGRLTPQQVDKLLAGEPIN